MQEVLEELKLPVLSKREVLANYDHIDLTEDEVLEAIVAAKIKKEKLLDEEKLKQREEFNRKMKQEQWDFDLAKTFFFNRAKRIFKFEFELDDYNTDIFELFCYYFNHDEKFFAKAKLLGVDNPSFNKGLMLAGNFGVGKTVLMKLFSQNKKQCYFIDSAKTIAESYVKSKEKVLDEKYLFPVKNAFQDPGVFCQEYMALCIDDLGAENIKNNFGNLSNVIGDLIEHRYDKGYTGPWLHGSSNLGADELKSFYGERVVSRMREIFNWIVVDEEAPDRRK